MIRERDLGDNSEKIMKLLTFISGGGHVNDSHALFSRQISFDKCRKGGKWNQLSNTVNKKFDKHYVNQNLFASRPVKAV